MEVIKMLRGPGKPPPPEGQNRVAWGHIVDFFLSDQHQKLSQKGSRNRSKHLYPSLHESRSYAQRRHLQEKESGTSSHIETWRKAHCTKGGAWINPKARKDWAKIGQQYAQMELEAGETHVDEDESLVVSLGKTRGHTRGVGRMVKRISRSESSGSSSSNQDTEMDAIKQQMFEMQERIKELEKGNKNPNDIEGGEDEDNLMAS